MILEAVKSTVVELLDSKKFAILAIGVLGFILNDRLGLGLSAETLDHLFKGWLAWMAAQGLADVGKSKAVEANTAALIEKMEPAKDPQ